MVSIDGNESLTNHYRGKNNYRKIIDNLKLIKRNNFQGEVIARMTVMEKTDIFILKPKKGTGTYIYDDYTDKYIKERLDQPNILTSEDILKNPNEYMVVLNFWYFNMLIDLKPYNSLYVHSLSEPFNEEMEISYNRMQNWLDHFNVNLVQSHCSGHICGYDLKKAIENIQPQTLFPIHTEHPGMFRNLTPKTQMIKEAKTYQL